MTPIPHRLGELCLTECLTARPSPVTDCHRSSPTPVKRPRVMSVFARRGGAGGRLVIPTIKEWEAWKRA